MIRKTIGRKVQGSSHIRSETKCQDSFRIIEKENYTIIAVADGHGSKACLYSDSGSRIAVNTFCKKLKQLYESYSGNVEQLITYLNRDGELGFAKMIDAEWKKKVVSRHKHNKREIPHDEEGKEDLEQVYRQYGTTLLGLLIADNNIFAFQLGDGDICFVTEHEVEMVINPDKILGVETHSLSKTDAWKNVITTVRKMNLDETLPAMISLSTDGFSNSYKSEQDFHETMLDYMKMINTYGLGAVGENLSGWLNETSENGSGDDITLCIAYFGKEETASSYDTIDGEMKEDEQSD